MLLHTHTHTLVYSPSSCGAAARAGKSVAWSKRMVLSKQKKAYTTAAFAVGCGLVPFTVLKEMKAAEAHRIPLTPATSSSHELSNLPLKRKVTDLPHKDHDALDMTMKKDDSNSTHILAAIAPAQRVEAAVFHPGLEEAAATSACAAAGGEVGGGSSSWRWARDGSTGNLYYYNSSINVVQWQPPQPLALDNPAPTSSSPWARGGGGSSTAEVVAGAAPLMKRLRRPYKKKWKPGDAIISTENEKRSTYHCSGGGGGAGGGEQKRKHASISEMSVLYMYVCVCAGAVAL